MSDWIKVEDRLPECPLREKHSRGYVYTSEFILCATSKGIVKEGKCLREPDGVICWRIPGPITPEVVAWMPMPEYKE